MLTDGHDYARGGRAREHARHERGRGHGSAHGYGRGREYVPYLPASFTYYIFPVALRTFASTYPLY